MLLEFSQYLERYLWPNYNPQNSNYAYVMSIAVMVNEKFREAVPAWDCFQDDPKQFSHFFEQVMRMLLDTRSVQKPRSVFTWRHLVVSLELVFER